MKNISPCMKKYLKSRYCKWEKQHAQIKGKSNNCHGLFPKIEPFIFQKLIKLLLIFMFARLPSRSINFLRLYDELKMKLLLSDPKL